MKQKWRAKRLSNGPSLAQSGVSLRSSTFKRSVVERSKVSGPRGENQFITPENHSTVLSFFYFVSFTLVMNKLFEQQSRQLYAVKRVSLQGTNFRYYDTCLLARNCYAWRENNRNMTTTMMKVGRKEKKDGACWTVIDRGLSRGEQRCGLFVKRRETSRFSDPCCL